MASADYWKKRMESIEDMSHSKGAAYANNVERQFRQAQKVIDDKIERWYQRLAENNEISLSAAKRLLNNDELEDFRMDVNEYIKKGKTLNYDDKWAKQLENASAKVHISRLEAIKLQMQQQCEELYGNMTDGLDAHLRDVYTNGYYHTAYEIQKGLNVGWAFNRLDERKIEKAINSCWTNDSKTFKARCWTNKTKLVNELNTVLTQSIIRGEDPQKAINQLAHRMKVSKYNAGRLIMTESAAISSMSQRDCFEELDVEEFEFVATLDTHTSEICRAMDGKHFKMSDYTIGLNAPPLHCFCRSCTVPYFADEEAGQRAARGEDGQTYYVSSDTTYKQWKKSFVDGDTNNLQEIGNSSTIKADTFIDKINAIKARSQGNYVESDIKEAGKAVKEELEQLRAPLKAQYEDAKAKYDAFGYERMIEEKKKLSMVNRSLMKPEELGLKSVDESLKKYRELDKKIGDMIVSPEFNAAHKTMNDAKTLYYGSVADNAKQLKDKLSEIRNMGCGDLDVTAHLGKSRSPMRPIIENAYNHYPTDWVRKSVEGGKLKVKKVDRGYYSHSESTIAISGWTDAMSFKTSVHELGHRFERVVEGIKDAEKLFYDRRTAGEALQWLGSGYTYSEKSRFDKFLSKYMGKDYGGSAYELVSMGFEYAYTKPVELWDDEDMAEWIYGLLALK
jgi:SPP1 gp7 family putative phage head morphogenesis protein|nr:MAG TPA: minor capsid protein [Caudoviricetes sp.]